MVVNLVKTLYIQSYFVTNGHIGMIKFMIENDKITRTNELEIYQEAMEMATRCGHIDVVKNIYMEYGLNIRNDNDSIIDNACLGGHIDMLEFLNEPRL